MSPEKLAYMANQIAKFFEAQPEAEAAKGVAKHISDFWAPRMRAELFAIAEAAPDTLDPLVREALPHIRKPTHA
jgi:formate dehydrogenase subunit delta